MLAACSRAFSILSACSRVPFLFLLLFILLSLSLPLFLFLLSLLCFFSSAAEGRGLSPAGGSLSPARSSSPPPVRRGADLREGLRGGRFAGEDDEGVPLRRAPRGRARSPEAALRVRRRSGERDGAKRGPRDGGSALADSPRASSPRRGDGFGFGDRGRAGGGRNGHGSAALPRRGRGRPSLLEDTTGFDTSKGVRVYDSFESMGLSDAVLRGLYAYGFERPSAIQARAMVPVLQGRDVIAQAQSGTGKTSLIGVCACALSDADAKSPQVLVLSPTRELAAQTERVALALGERAGVRARAAVGGRSLRDDAKALERGAQVVSATPGRAHDLVRRRALDLSRVKTLVLDEGDEMLGLGFKEQIYDVYRHLPPQVQIVLVSATLPPQVLELARTFMTDPVRILVARDELTLDGIRQFFVAVEREEWKFDTLCDLYDTLTITQAVIFVNSRKKCDWLAEKMRGANFAVSAVHGDMPQREREAVSEEFRSGASRVLIATDVWARGLDVRQVSLVINYDIPTSREQYIHRIGRSGRFGRKGVAINFVREEDIGAMRDIEQYYATQIDEMPMNVADLI